MRFDKFAIATAAAISIIAFPGLSQATSYYHATSGDPGFTYHPDHVTNGKSRAEVLAELEAARKDGTLKLIQRGLPVPVKSAGPAKTRQQVIDEMRSESPEERRARIELTNGG
ncbi:DUF4148 domain-containing protein [Methylibium petroleiphilum]|uniref:DUF4148 domain-containing protein n=1 Tax=Methylibium petroleiphilum TaxID=105560 RepID=UPI003D28B7EC